MRVDTCIHAYVNAYCSYEHMNNITNEQPEQVKQVVRIDEDLHLQLKIIAANERTTVSDLASRAVREMLERLREEEGKDEN